MSERTLVAMLNGWIGAIVEHHHGDTTALMDTARANIIKLLNGYEVSDANLAEWMEQTELAAKRIEVAANAAKQGYPNA